MSLLDPLMAAFRGTQRKPTVVLLVSSPLLLVWKYGCDPELLSRTLPSPDSPAVDPAMTGAICHFLGCFVLMGVIPALIVKGVFHERLRGYGAGVGLPARTLRTFVIFAPLFLAAAYMGSDDPALLVKFPINPLAGKSPSYFALHAAAYFLYYVGWEFYFRGFLLFGLRDSLGDAGAILVQVLASSLLHIGSPASETFGAIPAGILWGILAIRTRSLLPGLGQHFLLGISLDYFICYA